MPDITMCKDSGCDKRYDCYRYMAKPSGRQSYFASATRNERGYCGYQSLLSDNSRSVITKAEAIKMEEARNQPKTEV